MSEVPQVGDDGNSGMVEGLSEEQIAALRAAQAQVKMQTQGQASTGKVAEKSDEPIVVSELDRAKAENLHLRALVAAYKVKACQDEYFKAQEELKGYQEAIVGAQQELSQKYNINLQTHEIRGEDGVVVPRGQNADFANLMQSLAAGGIPTGG